VEADVYVWRYALLVVHARKEEEKEEEEATLEITRLQAVPAAWLGQVEPS